MTGIAGKSGVPSTPEHYEDKSRAGVLGVVAAKVARRKRRGKFLADAAAAKVGDPTIPPPDVDPANLKGIPSPAADLESYPDGESERQLAWHRHWGAMRAYQDFQKEKGKLMPITEVAERERAFDELWLHEIQSLPDLCSSLVPPDEREAAKAKAREWITDLRKRLAEAVEKT